MEPLLTTVHSFLYVQIHLRTFRIATTPSWKNCYNITNAPTKLHLSQMKRISGSHHLISLKIRLAALSLRECKLVFCLVLRHVNVRRIFRKRFEIWLVNTGHVKTKGVGKLDSFEHIRWYSSTKADKCSSCYLFLSLSEQVVYFHETDYCINLSHYLQLLAEVLQNRCS